MRVEDDATRAVEADAIVLPGVGAFGAAVAALAPGREALRAALAQGRPCLGICLGMQLLFEESEEGQGAGLAVMPGVVHRLRASRVPHMGWNGVQAADPADPLFAASPRMVAYYANSYVARPVSTNCVIAWSECEGQRFPAAVRQDRTWGVQFHPEKSGDGGLRLLDAFLEQAR